MAMDSQAVYIERPASGSAVNMLRSRRKGSAGRRGSSGGGGGGGYSTSEVPSAAAMMESMPMGSQVIASVDQTSVGYIAGQDRPIRD